MEYVYVSKLNQHGPLPPFLGYDPIQNVSLSKYLLSKKNLKRDRTFALMSVCNCSAETSASPAAWNRVHASLQTTSNSLKNNLDVLMPCVQWTTVKNSTVKPKKHFGPLECQANPYRNKQWSAFCTFVQFRPIFCCYVNLVQGGHTKGNRCNEVTVKDKVE